MAKTYRTAQGKILDMASLIAKNEKVKAVGNMNVNARGDEIDERGRVIKSVNDRTSESYGKTVGNRSAHVRRGPGSKPAQPKVQMTKEEIELDKMLEGDEEIEAIKAKETGKKK